MDEEIRSILRNFGWNEGFHIPVTNEKNRNLEFKIKNKLKKRNEAITSLEDQTNLLNSLKTYFDNIVQRRSQNEQLLADYRKQLEMEEKFINDLKVQKQNVIRDTKTTIEKKTFFVDENKRLKFQLNDLTNKCKHIRENINWSKELEEGWIEYVNKGKENTELFEKYERNDNAKFKELELKRLRLANEANEWKYLLDEKVNELKTTECNLKKITTFLENLRDERKWLVDQWRNAVQRILKTRHDHINNITKEINIVSEVSRNTLSAISQHKNFYDEQVNNNTQLKMQIRSISTVTHQQQLSNEKLKQELEFIMDQVTNKRFELTSLANKIRENRMSNANIKRKINQMNDSLAELTRYYDELKNKVECMKTRGNSMVDRTNQLEFLLRLEQKRFNVTTRENNRMRIRLQEIEFKISNINKQSESIMSQLKQLNLLHFKLVKKADEKRAENKIYAKTIVMTTKKIKGIDVRIRHIKNIENSSEMKLSKEKELNKLTDDYADKKRILNTILNEIHASNSEMKKLMNEVNTYSVKIRTIKCDKQNLIILIDGGQKLLNKITEENKEQEVTETMLRLRANQLENVLCQNNNKVFSMEKRKIDLQTASQERFIEIQNISNLLKIRKKSLQEEISNLKRNIDHINNHISQLLKRYEIIINGTGRDSENDEPLTITNYKIKLVKKRYFLLEKGDDLDEKIRKTEKEIQATENTLKLLNVTNNTLKKNIASIDEDSDEYKEKLKLQKERNQLGYKLQKDKRIIPNLQGEIETLTRLLLEQKYKEQQFQHIKKLKVNELSQLEKDINEQSMKLERVKHRLMNLKTSLKFSQNVDILEREFSTKELQQANKMVLASLTKLVSQYPELKTSLNTYLIEKKISLPLHEINKKVIPLVYDK